MSGKRSIFEEVSDTEKQQAVQPGMIDRGRGGARGDPRLADDPVCAGGCDDRRGRADPPDR